MSGPASNASVRALARGPGHLRILASAGSGKTYQLSSAYLQIVARGVPLHSILASTFTRLAAGEIRDRVLMRLAEAIENNGKREELARAIEQPNIAAEAFMNLLRQVTEHMPRMQIRTLDSFFASVVRAFEFELGIPPGSTVVDEAEEARLRAEAVRLMLDEADSQRLVDLLRAITQGQANRGVMREIDHVVSQMHGLYVQASPAAWECVPVLGRRLTADELERAIDVLLEVTLPEHMLIRTAHSKSIGMARSQLWEAFISAGFPSCILANKSEYNSRQITQEIRNAYQPVIDHAVAVLTGLWQQQTLATRALLELYDTQYRAVRAARRSLTFNDFTQAMARASGDVNLQEIYFRLDGSLHHLLLDEFQDTSVSQWQALRQLVSELVADETEDRTLVAVGDVKQSIYGWREAAPEVLERLPELLTESGAGSPMRDMTLTKSWRSSPVIIGFVNEVFTNMQGNMALAEYEGAAAWWDSVFAEHSTEKQDAPGYVCVRTVRRAEDAEETNSKTRIRCQAAADLVAALYRRDPLITIAVLARKNEVVGEMLYRLGPGGHDIPVSGRGGRALTDTAPVNAILDLLQLADHPNHTAGAFHVASSPLGEIVELTNPFDPRQRQRVASSVRRSVMRDGLAATIGGWVPRIAPSCDAWQQARLAQLVDLAARYDDRRTLRCDDFMDFVEATRVPSPRASVVQVMTIHQAKGMEFDAVVLVELDGNLVGQTPSVIFERDGPVGEIVQICRPSNKDIRALVPRVKAMYDAWKEQSVRGSLCALYVAVTRAKHGLYVLMDPVEERTRSLPKSSAGVIRGAMLNDPMDRRADEVLYEQGDADWVNHVHADSMRGGAADEVRCSETATCTGGGMQRGASVVTFREPDPGALRGWLSSPPSAHDEGMGRWLALPNVEARERGTIIHAFFEEVEYSEEFELDAAMRERLRVVAREALPRRDDTWIEERLAEFERSIGAEEVQAILARGGRRKEHCRLLREHPFARMREDGSIQQGTIDRLDIKLDSDGRAVAASVIDFKTDQIHDAAIEATAAHHRAQLASYREVVAKMLGLGEADIRMVVVLVALGRVWEL